MTIERPKGKKLMMQSKFGGTVSTVPESTSLIKNKLGDFFGDKLLALNQAIATESEKKPD